METVDRELLNLIQPSFPLVSEPFKAIGQRLTLSEEEVIQRIKALTKKGVVRQISAIFDTKRLGYKIGLVAMRYPPASLTRAAHQISRHPGISHNYARNGHFNLWFTLAVAPSESLEETVERMAQETGAEAARILPAIRLFKLEVNFDMVAERVAAYHRPGTDGYEDGHVKGNAVEPVTDFDIRVIRELQGDLPLCSRPFAGMANRLGITEEELFSHAHAFKARGIMRRYSAMLNHRQAGFQANGMAVWKVPPERSEEVGRILAAHPTVTHCYQRPSFPDWPYTHFSMIHATTKEECEEVARELSRQTAITDYQVLYSYREYKKTRIRYFV